MINLKEIRTFNNCSQQKLADLLNVSRSTVAMWETHQSEPSIEILNNISKIFNISLDYLLGESVDSEGISIARKRVAALLAERDLQFDDVETTFGTSIATLKAWGNGYGDFFNDKLDKLATFFDVSVDYLLGRQETKKATDNVGDSYLPKLTAKDELDISKKLNAMLEELSGQGGALMFDGEPLDDESRELLIASLENSIRMAKLIAKQKYTPKKYRKGAADDE